MTVNQKWEEPLDKTKPFDISKHIVWEAYLRVKANKGAAGIDEQSIADFERELKNNLYKIWNRMSSGSYFPPPVRTVSIPKSGGGLRKLGIPTVGDRIAQMVVKLYLEPEVEGHFHPDSYGYRPGKSALDAVGRARERCWKYDYVIDLDIKGFFDNLEHSLIMRTVKKHTDSEWILLYLERRLKASIQLEDGTLVERDRGTPQGSVISPVLMNMTLDGLESLLKTNFPRWGGKMVNLTCFADDFIITGKSKEILENEVKPLVTEFLKQQGLQLSESKTRITHIDDGFDFLASNIRKYGGKLLIKPSRQNVQAFLAEIKTTVRENLHIPVEKLLLLLNPKIRGWALFHRATVSKEIFSYVDYRIFCELKYWMRRRHPG